MATSFMPNYWSFLIVRAMYALGVLFKYNIVTSSFSLLGESAFTTIAPCVLGDLFTDETRSLVYGLFYMGRWRWECSTQVNQ